MDWEERIVANPDVLVGKPVIRGTRIAVEFVLERLAAGWSAAEIAEQYRVERADVSACLRYANNVLDLERVYPRAG